MAEVRWTRCLSGTCRQVFTGCSQGPGTGLEFCSYNHLFQSLRQACKDITAIGPICRWGNGGSEGSSGLCQGHTEWASGRAGVLTQACVANHPPSCLPTELWSGEFWVMFWLTWGHTLGPDPGTFLIKVWGQLPGVECLFPPDTDFDFLHSYWKVAAVSGELHWDSLRRGIQSGTEMRLDHSELFV